MRTKYQTIIIGGGISGLSCASELQKHKKEFLLITETIGGRILTSKDGNVNYGAYYVTKDYAHVLPFVHLKERLNPFRVLFHRRRPYSIRDTKLLLHSFQFMKLVFMLYKFRAHYNKFKRACENVSQKKALHKDLFLSKMYNMRAIDFIKEKGLEEITQEYLEEVVVATTFLRVKKHTAFAFLQFCLPIIVPTYSFRILKEKLISSFQNKIYFDSVVTLKKTNEGYSLKTKKEKQFTTKNVVVATPPFITKKLLNLKNIKKPVSVHMFHVKGIIKENNSKWQEYFFLPNNDISVIARQKEGTFLVYSPKKNPNLGSQFTTYRIIKHVFWNPAFHLEGTSLLPVEYLPHLYLIGDHNICGLEDSCITGKFAAHEILKQRS